MKKQDRARAIRLTADTAAESIRTRVAELAPSESADIVPVRLPVVGTIWMAVSHMAAGAVLKNSERFSMRRHPGGKLAGVAWWMPKTIRVLTHNMLAMDHPDHKRLRGHVDEVFARRAVLALEGQIEHHARTLLRRAKENAEIGNGQIDLMNAYARPLPLLVICELLGVPDRERERFSHHAQYLSGISGILSFVRALWPLRQLRLQVERLIEQSEMRLSGNGQVAEAHGLIDELVLLRRDGHLLSRGELISMVFLLLVAGHETTTHAISGSIMALHNAGLTADAGATALGGEECLRFVSPVQLSKPRFVRKGGVFMGAELEAGDLIMVSLASANHDEAKFSKPDNLKLGRRPNPHLEFGAGPHFCLGHQLARLELQVALRVLAEEWPGFAVNQKAVVYQPRLGLGVIGSLPVWPKRRVSNH